MFGFFFLHRLYRHRFVGARALSLAYAISPQQEACAVCGARQCWISMTPLGEMYFVKSCAKLLWYSLVDDSCFVVIKACCHRLFLYEAWGCESRFIIERDPCVLTGCFPSLLREVFMCQINLNCFTCFGDAWLGGFEFYLGMLWQPSRKKEDILKKDCCQLLACHLHKCRKIPCIWRTFYKHSLVTLYNKVLYVKVMMTNLKYQ